ncbi:DUF4365 domain-containing protein [Rhizobium leguminosarum]|uniref:DUF4365 domain-containing protein n=1 Tax=Rhizobium leguminosarum TaxID=384 RepID=UPI001C91A776|nr:DUF4365 domain-containing protein [Rhizobium leguminosarum]MBY2914668.1 DUF4365 domain-containing protein [Rhizobium leguminosarum]MBY2970207.1 DUF4365 domain-containing protein [Rhizobium leguminosarum]MBY2977580.1 DUF4365 domain-containing protein [Rhizobium leguminosarum]MBY2999176.1 DUF4365 domain-containing protein [Rhizobium leguminosarum]MBY3006130.1 DUF4365 domain-containing protein [Rhizobium leguminosarum]
MITIQHTQESLSRAYLHAISGTAGVNCSMDRTFDYGFDGTFRPVAIRGRRRVETGFPLDYQLKCTKNWTHEGSNVAYNIETKTFNDLVTRDPEGLGAILILLCVPEEQGEWAVFSEDFMTLRRCCYYTILEGDPVDNEQSKKKILIPRSNILTAGRLNQLLEEERNRKMGGA